MNNTALLLPTNATQIVDGSQTWANLTNLYANDANWTTTPGVVNNQVTNTLVTYDYDISLPANSVVSGIEVIITKKANTFGTMKDYSVHLMSDTSTIQGTNKNQGTLYFTRGVGITTYGSDCDLWGWDDILQADVESINFGIGFQAITKSDGATTIPSVNTIEVRVYYGEKNVYNFTGVPGTATEFLQTGGDVVWSTETNMKGRNPFSAVCESVGGVNTSYTLEASNFGFNFPSDAILKGIAFKVHKTAYGLGDTSAAVDDGVHLINATTNTLLGNNKAVTDLWIYDGGIVNKYGGFGDLWGTSLTLTDIEAASFGLGVSAKEDPLGVDTTEPNVTFIEPIIQVALPGTITSYVAMPGTTSNSTAWGGNEGWLTTDNIKTKNTTTYSYLSFMEQNFTSNALRAYNFDFSAIPNDAEIIGIEIEFARQQSDNNGPIVDLEAFIGLGTVREGFNQAHETSWKRTTPDTVIYGGIGQNWGWSDITVTDVKNSTFGFNIRTDNQSTLYDVSNSRIFYVQMTVHTYKPYSQSYLPLNYGSL